MSDQLQEAIDNPKWQSPLDPSWKLILDAARKVANPDYTAAYVKFKEFTINDERGLATGQYVGYPRDVAEQIVKAALGIDSEDTP